MIVNAGIKKVWYKNPYPDEFAVRILNEANVELIQYKEGNE